MTSQFFEKMNWKFRIFSSTSESNDRSKSRAGIFDPISNELADSDRSIDRSKLSIGNFISRKKIEPENQKNITNFHRKLNSLREKMESEKKRELNYLENNLTKKFSREIEMKEKEIKFLKLKLNSNSNSSINKLARISNFKNSGSQDSLRNCRIQDTNGNASAKMLTINSNLRDEISDLKKSVKNSESELKRKDCQYQCEMQRLTKESQNKIKLLTEEIEKKNRKIEKLLFKKFISSISSNSPPPIAASPSNFLTPNSGISKIEQVAIDATEIAGSEEMKLANSMSSVAWHSGGNRLQLTGPPNVISKDEFEKEKQRWGQKMNELENSLKKSEESNADLAQSKAEMIKKNKELEKVKKSVEEWNKKLTDRQKILNQDIKNLEQKLKEAQEETIKSTQTLESVTLECNRLKEKRYNPNRDDELEKLKQQNLEYCKSISALKQTILEKDRRMEILNQKIRKTKKSRNNSNVASNVTDQCDDADFNFSVSSMSLDTINEDFAEADEELELLNLKNSPPSPSNLPSESSWTQEKLKYASLVKAMNEKIQILESDQEKLKLQLGKAKEENELLEFQVLEMEHSQNEDISSCSSSSTSSITKKNRCDRSVSTSTSEDEGLFSMDHDDLKMKDLPLEELKVRFTLLKHRQELKSDDRFVVAQIKKFLENLEHEHAQCGRKFMENELKFKEIEISMKQKIDFMQLEMDDLKIKNKKKIKKRELQKELESIQAIVEKFKEENKTLQNQLEIKCTDARNFENALTIASDSEKKEREAAESLRQRLNDVVENKNVEVEILEKASKQQAQILSSMRSKISDLEKEIDELVSKNRSLQSEIDNLNKNIESKNFYSDEISELKKSNCAIQEKLTKSETEFSEMDRKSVALESKLKNSLKMIRNYEENFKNLKSEKEENLKIRILQEKRISELERELEIEKKKFLASPSCAQSTANERIDDAGSGAANERKIKSLIIEKLKLQKQFENLKIYSEKLENQFEIQIKIVDALKLKIQKFENLNSELVEKFKILFPNLKIDENFDSEKIENFQKIEFLIAEFWEILKFLNEHGKIAQRNRKESIEKFHFKLTNLKNLIEKFSTSDSVDDKNRSKIFEKSIFDLILQLFSTISNIFEKKSDSTGPRTISPSELCGSGTESELCDRSPMIFRKRCSTNSSDDSGRSATDSTRDQSQPQPPSDVRLAADFCNGRYLICWTPPENTHGIFGYTIYVKNEIKKLIINPNCTKAVIECNADDNSWQFITIRSIFGENGSRESISQQIDVEKSQRILKMNAATTLIKTKIDESHDSDPDECSEV